VRDSERREEQQARRGAESAEKSIEWREEQRAQKGAASGESGRKRREASEERSSEHNEEQ
jgi:hypothetical protein